MKSLQKGSKKLLNAWAFYDWANSVYSLTIASAIFPLFYGALFREAGIEKIEIFGENKQNYENVQDFFMGWGIMIIMVQEDVADY